MEQPPSLAEQFAARLKNNRFVAALIVIGVVVISLASFTDALMRLVSVIPNVRQAAITGQWESDVLKDVRSGLEYEYTFSLRSDGIRLYGNAVRLAPYCQEHTNDGVCSGYGDPVPILEGKFERNMLCFLFDWGELPGSVPFTWIETKEAFHGTSEGRKIRLVRQHDHNRQPWNSQSRKLPNWRMM